MKKAGAIWVPDSETYFVPFFEKDPVFERSNLETALKHVWKFELAVDGGAHVGSWARYLTTRFDRVIAYEPQLDNFECLLLNAKDADCIRQALGKEPGRASLASGNNSGCWHLTGGGDVEVVPLPDRGALDFLKLDVEGHEADVIEGCADQLQRYRPVVLIEEKDLPHKKQDFAARKLLESMGFKEVARCRRDVVFA